MSIPFGEWIIEQRHRKRMQAQEAAKRAGMSKQQWCYIEKRAKSEHDTATLLKIALGLDIPAQEVINAALSAHGVEKNTPSSIPESDTKLTASSPNGFFGVNRNYNLGTAIKANRNLQTMLEDEANAMTITETFAPTAVPLRTDSAGVIRVAGTRVTLDTLVGAYEDGASPEEIALEYDSVSLADIHAVISYYLRYREQVTVYLQERSLTAEAIQKENESRFPAAGIRARLMARRAMRGQI